MDWSTVEWALMGSGLLAMGTYLQAMLAIMPVDTLYRIDNEDRMQKMSRRSWRRWLYVARSNEAMATSYGRIPGLPDEGIIRVYSRQAGVWMMLMLGALLVFVGEAFRASTPWGGVTAVVLLLTTFGLDRCWIGREQKRLLEEYGTAVNVAETKEHEAAVDATGRTTVSPLGLGYVVRRNVDHGGHRE